MSFRSAAALARAHIISTKLLDIRPENYFMMKSFAEHDRVLLRTTCFEVPVQRMSIGVVLEAYGNPPSAYDVDFAGAPETYTVPADALVLLRE
jgi:hypothetical protein